MGTPHRRRTAGSVRHDNYYKLQRYDTITLAWVDIQHVYFTRRDAHDAAIMYPRRGTRFRIVTVPQQGRRTFGPPFTPHAAVTQ